MEAMRLGRPVLVRNIPGNVEVVSHERTGLVFSSPEEFVALGQRLLAEPDWASAVAARGQRHVKEAYAPASEQAAYGALLRGLQRGGPPSGVGGRKQSTASLTESD